MPSNANVSQKAARISLAPQALGSIKPQYHRPRWGGRALTNAFTDRFHGTAADEDVLAEAYTGDDPDIGVVYAGEAVGSVREERPAGQVIREIAASAEALLARFR